MKNPDWSRDELIVALDFYLRHAPQIPSKGSSEIYDLSAELNRLGRLLHAGASDTFRNVNGVYMKLMNFRRFDPSYSGTGLNRGNKDEEVVWELFHSDPVNLSRVAQSIRSVVNTEESDGVQDDFEAPEGRLLTRVHRFRERDPDLVDRKKQQVLKQVGQLRCEACCFNFREFYGELGEGFMECHHTLPISELPVDAKTKLSDLALVCSNCHSMIHRRRPWLSIEQLRECLSKKDN